MACPKCGSPWGRVAGNVLICGRCPYHHTIPLKPTYEDLEKKIKELEARIKILDI